MRFLAIFTLCMLACSARAAEPPVDFAKDVLPILRQSCHECHGPQKQKGGLRLDTRANALKGGDGGPLFVAGKPAQSEIIRRVALAKGDPEVMPARGEPLSKAQVELLWRWVAEGAKWPEAATAGTHWAYVKPVRPAVPAFTNDEVAARFVRNPIDPFVFQRLKRERLSPSPEAAKEILLRRVSLDLTGLPPTPAEVEAFVKDTSPNAYEKQVDRLLASPQFGVKWARPWLDAARYADSHGFQRDDFRDLWPYRDWVVNALNADMPFDRFTVEQLAGDLLPNPTQDQLIATGFNRSAPTNVEAGSEPEETRVNQVFDRVNTLGTVWLGTTLECCQCHDHKYDPFTAKDYYRLFAVFNSTEIEAERTNPKVPGSIAFRGPTLTIKDDHIEAERKRVEALIADALKVKNDRAAALATPDAVWEAGLLKRANESPSEHVLEVAEFESLNGATHEVLPDKSVLLSGEAPNKDTYTVKVKTKLRDIRAIKLEALTHPSLPGTGPGRGDEKRANFVLNTFAASTPGKDGKPLRLKFAKARADFSQANRDVKDAIDDDPASGWAIAPKFFEPHHAVFEFASPQGTGDEVVFTFTLVQNFGSSRTIGRLRLSAITGDAGAATIPAEVVAAIRTPAEKRTESHAKALADYRLTLDKVAVDAEAQLTRLRAELAGLKPPTTLIMKELPAPRETHVLKRGDFRTPGEKVTPGTPEVLPAMKGGTRLDVAKWLVSEENPLTARVTVNRLWAELFGQGLVLTPEDFGIKGEKPTHPELLDWLAVEFQSHWSTKKLLKTIVMSGTYRQSSRVTPESLARDDRNLLLARGPRFRLSAEGIRDNALSIAGLLSLNQGGEPVRPYQPDGIWVKVGGQRYDYLVSPGEEKYRRGLYVVLKRGAPYPSFMNFDATNRMACRVKRPRSNTPLQALTLLNDPVYVEATMAFAKRVLLEGKGSSDERIDYAFRVALARPPRPAEAQILKTLFNAELAAMKESPGEAKKLVGSFALPPKVTPEEFAAWYAVCSAILNLDETITKG
jgi:hypothetical protein